MRIEHIVEWLNAGLKHEMACNGRYKFSTGGIYKGLMISNISSFILICLSNRPDSLLFASTTIWSI